MARKVPRHRCPDLRYSEAVKESPQLDGRRLADRRDQVFSRLFGEPFELGELIHVERVEVGQMPDQPFRHELP